MFLLVANYYITLISSKDHYTREEIANIFPFISSSLIKLKDRYNTAGLLLAMALSSLIGGGIPRISSHWFFNSSLLFLAVYFIFPILKERIESYKVSTSEYYRDALANYFSQYSGIIIIGLGTGMGASLMYNWASIRELSFLWLLLNLAVITVLVERVLGKEMSDQ
jgi:hypothetical protein